MKDFRLSVVGFAFLALLLMIGSAAVDSHAYEETSVGNSGSIVGSVVYLGSPPELAPVEVRVHPEVCDREPKYPKEMLVAAQGGLGNAVVRLDGITSGKPFAKEPGEILQTSCEFQPYVSLIPVDRELVIRNQDEVFHCVHALRGNNKGFNYPVPELKPVRKLQFSKPDFVNINCYAHPWMTGWVVVQDHPYYAVTDAAGGFAIRDVPPGRYRLIAWHEVLGEQSVNVQVKQGGASKVDIRFPAVE